MYLESTPQCGWFTATKNHPFLLNTGKRLRETIIEKGPDCAFPYKQELFERLNPTKNCFWTCLTPRQVNICQICIPRTCAVYEIYFHAGLHIVGCLKTHIRRCVIQILLSLLMIFPPTFSQYHKLALLCLTFAIALPTRKSTQSSPVNI